MRPPGPNGGFQAGFGYVLSLQLQSWCDVSAFYDSLLVNKGPSLGTAFTLVCPYTLLAHYGELDWAAQYGVHRDLIRVSVGLEDCEVCRICMILIGLVVNKCCL